MKAFIAGVITLSILIAAVWTNAYLLDRNTDKLLKEIKALPDSAESADDEALLYEWESSRSWIALTVHRQSIDDIDDTLAQLSLEISYQNDLGYLIEKTRLLEIVERLKKTESFSLSRIF